MEQTNIKSPNELGDDKNKDNISVANKRWYITIGVAVMLIVVLWIWKTIELNNHEKKAEKQQNSLKEQATKLLVQSHEQHLKLLAKPYVWAIRSEMMRNNINQLNLYSIDMVQEKNFQKIAVANDKGIVISSTNKKDEGQSFLNIGEQEDLTRDSTAVKNINDSILIMTSPIMGFNNRLGTLLIKYAIQKHVFNLNAK